MLELDDSKNKWTTTTSYDVLCYTNMMKCYTQAFGSIRELARALTVFLGRYGLGCLVGREALWGRGNLKKNVHLRKTKDPQEWQEVKYNTNLSLISSS